VRGRHRFNALPPRLGLEELDSRAVGHRL